MISFTDSVCVAGAFLQHGVWPGARRRPLRDAGGLLGGLQGLLWHFLLLPDDGHLPHRREVQPGLQGAHPQRVSFPHVLLSSPPLSLPLFCFCVCRWIINVVTHHRVKNAPWTQHRLVSTMQDFAVSTRTQHNNDMNNKTKDKTFCHISSTQMKYRYI